MLLNSIVISTAGLLGITRFIVPFIVTVLVAPVMEVICTFLLVLTQLSKAVINSCLVGLVVLSSSIAALFSESKGKGV